MKPPRVAAIIFALGALSAAAGLSAASGSTTPARPATTTVSVRVSDGHRTKPIDNGRPVVLVASALGVPEKVFRHAFSLVTPAPAGSEPDPDQVQRNKAALLSVLSPYGVTNDDLDRVSNHYRYNRGAGGSWPRTAALVKATLSSGRIKHLTIVRGGSGYTSAPTLTVAGVPGSKVRAKVSFSKSYAANGRVSAVSVAGG